MAKVTFGDRIAKNGKVLVGCAAVIFDPTGENILLTRRTDNGLWCLPGGGMDPGESIQETAIREVWEETGLEVEITRLVGIYSNPHMLLEYPDGNRFHLVSFCFQAVVTGGELGLSSETTEVGYFTPDEMQHMDIMVHHRERIEDVLLHSPDTLVR